jgi:HTH-type transcriptional regulator, glycine betaine synthesis regulator
MLLVTENKKPVRERKDTPAAVLSEVEAEAISMFVQFSRVLGQPRSIAEIYGLLFISGRPLPMEDVVKRLGISLGSGSQGLRFLRKTGAVNLVYVPGDRRVHYEAVAELRKLASRFLQDQVLTHLDGGTNRLERLGEKVKQLPAEERARVGPRVTILQSWEKRSRRFLPALVKMLNAL